ncbi:polysaccharide deacetylase family protein [Virgibacillus ndiopensis]|uniref:polysaccharide deacetylase family protein n=1 Tax=Virgibacillus ndiopensis TaxID=2004408 RepID=UPI000C083C67|nr:polysaccharide deacetylase family protein [Virgibacillus ndiopensis]
MKKRRQLNRQGKFLVFVLMTLSLFFIVGLMDSHSEKEAHKKEKAVPSNAAEPLIPTFESKEMFSKSKLNQSIQAKKLKEKEESVAQNREEQRKKDQKDKAIYLTFDDGPTTHTTELLQVLDHYDAKATFFMIGPNIKQHSEVVKRIANQGLGLGLHGISHSVHDIYADKTAPTKEMTEAQQILQEITGIRSKLVRLPYGSVPYLTDDMRYLLYQNGFKIWDWNVDSKDWELGDKRYVKQTIQEIEKLEQADQTPVVLMHDRKKTIRYLPQLLGYLKKNGYQTKKITNEVPALTFTCNGRCYAI